MGTNLPTPTLLFQSSSTVESAELLHESATRKNEQLTEAITAIIPYIDMSLQKLAAARHAYGFGMMHVC